MVSSHVLLRFRQTLWILFALIVLPLASTYWSLSRWLAVENCYLWYNDSSVNNTTTGGLICQGASSNGIPVDILSPLRPPESIVHITSHLKSIAVDSKRDILQKSSEKEQASSGYRFVYAIDLWSSPMSNMWNSPTPKISTLDNGDDLGVGANPNKKQTNLPLATYFWLVLNVGLYGILWHYAVDPSIVALDRNLLGNKNDRSDFGRALTGNLAHFEIWHLGLNAMSLVSLGEALEGPRLTSPELLLWTASFLVWTTIGVVGLHMLQSFLQKNHRSPRFPSMVGFSGILFCWSTFRTLSLEDHQQICPVPVLSNLCFATHRFGKHGRFSWAPLVQLAMVQMMLPRASFAGHLSGILVGFLWYWGILPPLEWSQPSILFPIVWGLGKYVLYKHWVHNGEDGSEESVEMGHVLGGNRSSVGRSSTRWTGRQEYARTMIVQNLCLCCIGIHWMIFMAFRWKLSRSIDSIVVSEGLILALFLLFVRATCNLRNDHDTAVTQRNPFGSIGILGRVCVAFSTIAIITDAMTIGGWMATTSLWWELASPQKYWFLLWWIRLGIWTTIIGNACFVLDRSQELEETSGGIWSLVFRGWFIDPFRSWMKFLIDQNIITALLKRGSSSTNDWSGQTLGATTMDGSMPLDRNEISARRAKLFSAKASERSGTIV